MQGLKVILTPIKDGLPSYKFIGIKCNDFYAFSNVHFNKLKMLSIKTLFEYHK